MPPSPSPHPLPDSHPGKNHRGPPIGRLAQPVEVRPSFKSRAVKPEKTGHAFLSVFALSRCLCPCLLSPESQIEIAFLDARIILTMGYTHGHHTKHHGPEKRAVLEPPRPFRVHPS